MIPTIISQLAAGAASIRLGSPDPVPDLTYAAALACSFAIGRPCALWIWRRYPGDLGPTTRPPAAGSTDSQENPNG